MRAERRTISSMSAVGVEVEPVDDAEARAQRRRQQPGARRRADQRELLQRHLHRARARPLADDDVELVVLHRRIEDLLDRRRQPVDLVDEQHLVRLQVGQHAGQVAGLLDHRAGGGADRHAHLVADDVGERRLAEPGRAVEQHVIERLAAAARGRDRHLQVVADAVLADVLVERARAQPGLVLRVVVDAAPAVTRRAVAHDRISSRSAARSACSKRGVAASPASAVSIALSTAAADDSRGSAAPTRRSSRSAIGRRRGRRPAPAGTDQLRQPILQLEHDALGGLLADAGNARSAARRRRAARRATSSRGFDARQHRDRQLRPDAADADQPLEQLPLERR